MVFDAAGSKTADGWSSMLDDPADGTSNLPKPLSNTSSASASSAALPLIDKAASDRQTVQTAQKGDLGKTLPGLGSVVRQPVDSLASAQKKNAAVLLAGQGAVIKLPTHLGASTDAQTVDIIGSSGDKATVAKTGSLVAADSNNRASTSSGTTSGISSSSSSSSSGKAGSETKSGNAVGAGAKAGSGRTARQDAERLLMSLQQTDKLSERAQRRLAPPTLQLQQILANDALPDNAPEVRSPATTHLLGYQRCLA